MGKMVAAMALVIALGSLGGCSLFTKESNVTTPAYTTWWSDLSGGLTNGNTSAYLEK